MDNIFSLQFGFDVHYVVYLWGGRRVTGAFTRNLTGVPLRFTPAGDFHVSQVTQNFHLQPLGSALE
jgi:hypothetical protein